MKKLVILPILFLVPLMLLSSCSRKKLDKDTLYFNLVTEPPTLDPNLATDTTSSKVIRNLFDGLIEYDTTKPDMPIIPAVAKSWTSTKGGKVWTFKLRRDVKWSDGKPVTAHDFEYSWMRLLNPSTATEYAYFLFDIINAQDYNSGKIKDASKVGIKALDDYTFQLTLIEPVAYFIHIPAFGVLNPIRKDVVDKWGDSWTEPEHIVTNGPYTLAKWRHDYELILERNENYYGTPAKMKFVHCYMVTEQSTSLSLYQTGKIDIIRELPPAEMPKLKLLPEFHSGNFFSVYYIGLNTKKKPFDNPYVRRALSAAVDRREIVEVLGNYGQVPTSSFVPLNMLGYDPNVGIPFNIEKAKKWMTMAGYVQEKRPNGMLWVDKKTKKALPPLTITYNTNESHKTVAENLQAQWKKNLGVEIVINNQEWKVYLKTLQTADKNLPNAPFHLYRMGWVGDFPDPDNFMKIFTSYSEQNHTGWHSKAYDRLIARGKASFNDKARERMYKKAQRILLQEGAAIIPLYVYSFEVMYKDHVKGIHLNSLDLWDFNRISVVRK